MFKIRYHPPGTAPATLSAHHASAAERPLVAVIHYHESHFEERAFPDLLTPLPEGTAKGVTWIDLRGLGDIDLLRRLGDHYQLHPLALEDVLNTTQRPKIEAFENCLFIVSHMVYFDQDEKGANFLCSEQVSIFLGQDFVVTIQEDANEDVFELVRERLRQGRGFARKHGADYLVYALLDAMVDHSYPVLETIGEGLEAIEDEIEDRPLKSHLSALQEYKRMLLQLRRAAWPNREILNSLMRDEFPQVEAKTKIFLRDCYDHAIQILELTESYREMTSDLVELWMSGVGMRTNEIMRVLTVISSIFIPLTFIAGVYGMNFNPDKSPWNMPELDWYYGYPACLLLMALLGCGMVGFFRWKKWL